MSDKPVENMNELAARLTKMESGDQELSIAQVKEVLACLKAEVKAHPLDTMAVLNKYFSEE